MKKSSETFQLQKDFSNFCRKKGSSFLYGDKRTLQYSRLIYNNIDDLLQTSFPITVQKLSEEIWNFLINDFMAYIQGKKYAFRLNLPFLDDLLYFEWLEIELFNQEDEEIPKFSTIQNYFTDHLVFTPEFKLVHFEYAVHKMELEEGDFYLLLHRVADSGKIIVTELSALFYFSIDFLQEHTLAQLILLLQTEHRWTIKEIDLFSEKIVELLEHLENKEFLLGKK